MTRADVATREYIITIDSLAVPRIVVSAPGTNAVYNARVLSPHFFYFFMYKNVKRAVYSCGYGVCVCSLFSSIYRTRSSLAGDITLYYVRRNIIL